MRFPCLLYFMITSVVLLSLVGAFDSNASTANKIVVVTAIVEHPALNAVRDGVKDELQASGYEAGKNLKFAYQSAQGSNVIALQIARKYAGSQPDVIVAITTPSAQALVAATKSVSIVYAAVIDPVEAKLVKSLAASGTNVTGVSDASPLLKQINLIRQVAPRAKRIGIIYSPGEANSVSIVRSLKRLLVGTNLILVEAAAARTIDVPSAIQNLVGKVDLIYAPTDNNVMSVFESIVKVAEQAKLPIIAADTYAVKRGAAAAIGLNYYNLGRQTGKIVVRILNGEAAGKIASQTSTTFELYVNPKAAQRQGLTLLPELIRSAKVVVAQ